MSNPLDKFNMDWFRLDGKIAMVTGANQGLGMAYAVAFAKAGANLFIPHFTEDVSEIKALIEKEGRQVHFLRGDLTDKAYRKDCVDECMKQYGRIDILVNNAGILSLKKPFVEYTKADWDKIFGINFMGDVFFCKAVIPTMKEKKAGRIINMASQSAETGGLAASPIYAASKAAVWCMTKSLAGEMGPYQVTVNAVAPGYIMTEMTRNAGYRDDMVPMKRLGTPEDVADVVGFLASEDSRYVTGMIVDINGGTVMR